MKQLLTPDQDRFMQLNLPESPKEIDEQKAMLALSRKSLHFLYRLWPSTRPISVGVNSIFLGQIESLDDLAKKETWWVRDGAIPLLWFFDRFPEPNGLSCKLVIDADLAQLVPKPWRRLVDCFRVVSTKRSFGPSRVVIVGGISRIFTTIESVEHALKKIGQYESMDSVRECLLFVPAQMLSRLEESHIHYAKIYQRLFQILPPQTVILNYDQLVTENAARQARVYSLNSKSIVADDGLLHLLLAQGAAMPHLAPVESLKVNELSPFHGVQYSALDVDSPATRGPTFAEFCAFKQKLSDKYQVEAFGTLPWSNWFHEWAGQRFLEAQQ